MPGERRRRGRRRRMRGGSESPQFCPATDSRCATVRTAASHEALVRVAALEADSLPWPPLG